MNYKIQSQYKENTINVTTYKGKKIFSILKTHDISLRNTLHPILE